MDVSMWMEKRGFASLRAGIFIGSGGPSYRGTRFLSTFLLAFRG